MFLIPDAVNKMITYQPTMLPCICRRIFISNALLDNQIIKGYWPLKNSKLSF